MSANADTLAAWEFTGVGSYGTSPLNPTSSSATVIVGGLTRGIGLTTTGTAASNAFGANGWDEASTTAALAVTANDFVTLSVTAVAGQQVSLSAIETFNLRRSNSGPTTTQLQYQVGAGAFVDLGSPLALGNASAGTVIPAIDLTGIAALQGVAPGTTITFRFVNYANGATGATGTWYIQNVAATNPDLIVSGTTAPVGGGDTTPPIIAVTSPTNGASGVAENTDLVFALSEASTVVAGKNLIIKKTSDNSTVQTIPLNGVDVSMVGNTVTINPPVDLAANTSYFIDIDAGAYKDAANNSSAAFSGTASWTFSTPAPITSSPIVISQIYEGSSGTNKWIELHNVSGASVSLDNYVLALWTNANSQAWKGSATTTATLALTGVTLGAGEYYLIGNTASNVPGYAVADKTNNTVANFNGNDSVVLYNSATIAPGNIADAFSVPVSGDPGLGADISVYRLDGNVGYNLTAGSSFADFPSVWATKTVAEVASALPTDEFYLKHQGVASAPPVIDPFAIAFDLPQATEKVTLNYVLTSGNPATEYRVSETDPTFASTPYVPITNPLVYTLSAGNGTKTVYFQLKNSAGPSAIVSDTIERVSYAYPGSVVISQYSSDSSPANSKYIELSNRTASAIDLTGWTLQLWTNLETQYWTVTGFFPTGLTQIVTLDGYTIPAGGTIVVANPDATIPLAAGSATVISAAMNFSGNDSMALYAPGTVSTVTLADVVSFTFAGGPEGLGEGRNTSFVRLSDAQGFNFSGTAALTAFPAVWSEVSLATVAAATSTQNEFLGTYTTGPVGNTYGSWALANTGSALSSINGDHDFDGVKNGVEYFFGATGSTFTSMPVPDATRTVSYPIAVPAPTSATYVIETSTNLTTWAAVDPLSVNTSTPGFVKYTLPASTPGAPKLFTRLHVIVTP